MIKIRSNVIVNHFKNGPLIYCPTNSRKNIFTAAVPTFYWQYEMRMINPHLSWGTSLWRLMPGASRRSVGAAAIRSHCKVSEVSDTQHHWVVRDVVDPTRWWLASFCLPTVATRLLNCWHYLQPLGAVWESQLHGYLLTKPKIIHSESQQYKKLLNVVYGRKIRSGSPAY